MMQAIQKRSMLILSSVVLSFISLLTQAQDKKVDVDINVGKEQQWYMNPVVWVVGGAVFILLLVALLRKK
jgi:hypothetical protein